MVYPRSSAGLITRTLDTGGAVVSISPWGMGPRKFAFPRRNRVIAACRKPSLYPRRVCRSGTFLQPRLLWIGVRELLGRAGVDPIARVAWHELPHCERCLLHCRRGVHRDGYLSHIRHPALLAPDAPGIADLNPTQQTVMHALIASPLKVDDIAALVSLDAVGVLKTLGFA